MNYQAAIRTLHRGSMSRWACPEILPTRRESRSHDVRMPWKRPDARRES